MTSLDSFSFSLRILIHGANWYSP